MMSVVHICGHEIRLIFYMISVCVEKLKSLPS